MQSLLIWCHLLNSGALTFTYSATDLWTHVCECTHEFINLNTHNSQGAGIFLTFNFLCTITDLVQKAVDIYWHSKFFPEVKLICTNMDHSNEQNKSSPKKKVAVVGGGLVSYLYGMLRYTGKCFLFNLKDISYSWLTYLLQDFSFQCDYTTQSGKSWTV